MPISDYLELLLLISGEAEEFGIKVIVSGRFLDVFVRYFFDLIVADHYRIRSFNEGFDVDETVEGTDILEVLQEPDNIGGIIKF